MKGKELANRAVSMLKALVLKDYSKEFIGHSQLKGIVDLCCVIKNIEQLLTIRKRACVEAIQRAAVRILTSTIFSRLESLR